MKTLNIKKEVTINAPVEKVFPLVCPVSEYDWIPGWKCHLLYCPGGRIEKDVAFKEKMSSPFLLNKIGGKTTWTTLLYDKVKFRVHFNWDNKISSSIYKMEMDPIDSSQTRLSLSLNMKIIDDRGSWLLDPAGNYKIGFLIEGLGAMLKHYCETGKQLDSKGSQRKSDFIGMLSVSEKLTFLLNKINMMLTPDRDRRNYLSHGRISRKTLQKKRENGKN
jgi:hypothetical protein